MASEDYKSKLRSSSKKSESKSIHDREGEEEVENRIESELDSMPMSDGKGEGEDLDGIPLDGAALLKGAMKHTRPLPPPDEDLDGVPMYDDLNGEPMEDIDPNSSAKGKISGSMPAGFVPSQFETVDPEQVEAQAMTTSNWDLLEQTEKTEQTERDEADSGGGDDSHEGDYRSNVRDLNEDCQAKLHEIELRVAQYQNKLKCGLRTLRRGWNIEEQVNHYRKKLLRKAKKNNPHVKEQCDPFDKYTSMYVFRRINDTTVRAVPVQQRSDEFQASDTSKMKETRKHPAGVQMKHIALLLFIMILLVFVGLQLQPFVRKKSMRVPTAKAGNRFYKLKITISESYQEEQENGKDLNSDQLQAVSRYDEVQQTLEFARDLSKQFNGIAVDAAKQHKKQARKEALEKAQQEVAKDVLHNMGKRIVREDFLAGRNGVTQLQEEDLKYLDDLYSEVSPKHGAEEESPSFQDQVQQIAKYLLVIVEGLSKEIVGTTYAKLKELVATIHASAYFDQAQEEVIEAVQEVADEGDLVNALEPTGEEVYVDKTPAVQPTETFPQVVCEEEPSSEVIIKKEKPEAFTTSEEKKHTKRKHSLENSYEL